MYMVISLWRGAHHIVNMRGFNNIDEAKAYAIMLKKEEFEVCVYELLSNAPPRKVLVLDWRTEKETQ